LRISRYHAALTVENDAIDHRHGHRQTRQIASHQFVERPLRGREEAARHRGAAGGAGAGIDRLAQRLGYVGVASSGHSGEHPLHDDLVEQLSSRKCRPGVETNLGTVGGSASGPLDADPPTAHDHRTRSDSVAAGGPVGDPRVAWTYPSNELGLHHLSHHQQAGRRGEGEQAVLDRGCKVSTASGISMWADS
jgi:hypothetical protein